MKVILAPFAVRDIEDIIQYIREQDSRDAAIHELDNLEQTISTLTDLPNRGAPVKELSALGIKNIREIYFKPYRIIYEIESETVHVFCVADGRRDMLSLLEKRILEA
jgi:toxin ParE1/3/4